MSDNDSISLLGVHEAPNIQETPDTYEIENQAADPNRVVEATMIEQFWANHGFSLCRVASEWNFKSRADLEAVVHIEFPGALADKILDEHKGNRVEYHYCLYYRRY